MCSDAHSITLSSIYWLLSRLFWLLRKRSGIRGKYMDKKASLKLRKETTLRYRLASMYHSNRNKSTISSIGIVNLSKIKDGHAIFRMKLETCNWYSSSLCVYISLYTPSKKLTRLTRFGKTTSGKVFHTEFRMETENFHPYILSAIIIAQTIEHHRNHGQILILRQIIHSNRQGIS